MFIENYSRERTEHMGNVWTRTTNSNSAFLKLLKNVCNVMIFVVIICVCFQVRQAISSVLIKIKIVGGFKMKSWF